MSSPAGFWGATLRVFSRGLFGGGDPSCLLPLAFFGGGGRPFVSSPAGFFEGRPFASSPAGFFFGGATLIAVVGCQSAKVLEASFF